MRIGIQISSFKWPGGTEQIGTHLAEIAKTADAVGFSSIWVMDHYFQIPNIGPAEDPMLEGYSALNYMAGVTQDARLGTLVTGVIYRHPGLLVKTVTTLDVLSGGRAYLGIGAAWNEQESKGLGVPFPSTAERFERLEETLQIAKQMWAGDVKPFNGKHYQLAQPLNSPQPISKPHPPILIGGSGEKKTLRLVAQYADACNLFAMAGDELKRKLDILKGHCDEIGRDYNEIEKTALGFIAGPNGVMTTAQIVEMCQRLARLGIQHLIVGVPNVHEIKPIEWIGREVIPAVAGL